MKPSVHQFEDKLLEFAYGELPSHEADAVDAHVRGCARCTEALGEIRAVRSTMSALPMEEAPSAGLDSLLAYAEQAAARNAAPAASTWGARWKRWLTPLVTVSALTVVGVMGLRASQEFDTSAPSVMADQKIAQGKAEAKDLEPPTKTDRQPEPAPIVAGAPPPATAYAEPSLADAIAKNQIAKKEERAAEPRDQSPAGFKEGKSDEVRRAVAEDPALGALREDFGNATSRVRGGGGPTQGLGSAGSGRGDVSGDGEDDSTALYGLTGGKQSVSSKSPIANKDEPARARLQAPQEKEEEKVASPGLGLRGTGAVIPAAPAPVPATAAPSAAPEEAAPSQRGSYSLSTYRNDPSQKLKAAQDEGDFDQAFAEQADKKSLDDGAKRNARTEASTRTSNLEAARLASAQGNRSLEIKLLLEVMQSGATGSERVEALKRLCDAYEALGDSRRADPYCDELLAQYPNTAAAQLLTQRRGAVQTSKPLSPAKAKAAPAAEQSKQ